MSSKRLFFVFIILVSGFLLLGGVIVSKSSSILGSEGEKLMSLKVEDKVLDMRLADLMKAKKNIDKYSELADITKQIVPEDKNQASVIAEIPLMAKMNGITISSIDFPQSSLGSKQKKSAKTKTDTSKSQLVELPELKGVYVMSIDIGIAGDKPVTYDQILSFLKTLESNRKTAQVTNISISPNKRSGFFDLQISIDTYVRPE